MLPRWQAAKERMEKLVRGGWEGRFGQAAGTGDRGADGGHGGWRAGEMEVSDYVFT